MCAIGFKACKASVGRDSEVGIIVASFDGERVWRNEGLQFFSCWFLGG